MRKYGWVIVVGTLLAVVLGVFLATYHTPIIDQLTFTEQVCGMDLKLFHDEKDDIYYLFIPAYVDKGHISINKPDDVSVRLVANGQDCGTSLANLPLNEPVEFIISPPYNRTESYTLELLQNENLPTLFIETGEGGAEFIRLNKESKTQAAIMAVNETGTVEYSGLGTLTGRGNTTFGEYKMPYNIKFNKAVSLVAGTDNTNKWCLLANYGDDSQIRNAICYYIARELGISYTSEVEFISLYINGLYQGLYNLANKQSFLTDAGDKVVAVFEKNLSSRPYDNVSNFGFYIRTRYGSKDSILNAVNTFETALFRDSCSYQQLERYANMRSVALKCFVDDVCADSDPWLSQYYALDRKGRISAICAWDYDLSLGASNFSYSDFSYNQLAKFHSWYNALIEYAEFRQELSTILTMHSCFFETTLVNYTDSICKRIEADWFANSIRWKNFPSFRNGNSLIKNQNYNYSTLAGHQAYIKSFLEKRMFFLNEYWDNPEQFCKITFNIPDHPKDVMLYYHRGDTLSEDKLPDGLLTMPNDGFVGWYTKDGTSVTDVGVVTHDMSFEERLTPKPRATALMEKALHKAWLLILIAVFGCFSLWLFVKVVLIPIKEAKG